MKKIASILACFLSLACGADSTFVIEQSVETLPEPIVIGDYLVKGGAIEVFHEDEPVLAPLSLLRYGLQDEQERLDLIVHSNDNAAMVRLLTPDSFAEFSEDTSPEDLIRRGIFCSGAKIDTWNVDKSTYDLHMLKAEHSRGFRLHFDLDFDLSESVYGFVDFESVHD
jgi:hypothetical protein